MPLGKPLEFAQFDQKVAGEYFRLKVLNNSEESYSKSSKQRSLALCKKLLGKNYTAQI